MLRRAQRRRQARRHLAQQRRAEAARERAERARERVRVARGRVAREVARGERAQQLGLRGEATVRDLWAQRTLDPASGALTAEVPPHGTRMFKLTTAARVLTSAASVVVVESA